MILMCRYGVLSLVVKIKHINSCVFLTNSHIFLTSFIIIWVGIVHNDHYLESWIICKIEMDILIMHFHDISILIADLHVCSKVLHFIFLHISLTRSNSIVNMFHFESCALICKWICWKYTCTINIRHVSLQCSKVYNQNINMSALCVFASGKNFKSSNTRAKMWIL